MRISRIWLPLLVASAQCVFAQTATNTTLILPNSPVPIGSSINLSASVQPPSATGRITFTDNFQILGSAPVVNGTATLTTRLLETGRRRLRAAYTGSPSFAPSKSARALLQVTMAVPQFARIVELPSFGAPTLVRDVTGDGVPDLLSIFQSTVIVYPGSGNGTFGTPKSNPISGASQAIADFDSDGKVDIGATGGYHKGAGDGTFSFLLTPSPNIFPGTALDANGDGKADIVGLAPPVNVCSNPNGSLRVALGDGTGQFATAFDAPSGKVAPADFNGDDSVDFASLVLANSSACASFAAGYQTYQSSSATWTQQTFADHWEHLGDITGDGIDDIVAWSNGLRISYVNSGAGNFTPRIDSASEFTLGLFDWNNDGRLDLFGLESSGVTPGLWYRPSNGDGTFGLRSVVYSTNGNGPLPQLVELNGDGALDLIATVCTPTCRAVAVLGSPTLAPLPYEFSVISSELSGGSTVTPGKPIVLTATVLTRDQGLPSAGLELVIGPCRVSFNRLANTVRIGSELLQLPSHDSIEGSYCSVSGGGTTISASGSSLTVQVVLSMLRVQPGLANVQMRALDSLGNGTTYRQVAAYTIGAVPVTPAAPLSIDPSSGGGKSAVFRVTAQALSADLMEVRLLLNNVIHPSGACFVSVDLVLRTARLFDDAGTQWLPPSDLKNGQPLSNLRCSLDVANIVVRQSGNIWTIDFPLTFHAPSYGFTKLYSSVRDSRQDGPFVQFGTWSPRESPAVYGVPSVEQLSSLPPSVGTWATYSHSGGSQQLYLMYFLVLPTPNIAQYTAAGSCLVEYNRISNGIRLINDAGDDWLGPLSGVPVGLFAPDLQNSRCHIPVRNIRISVAPNTISILFTVQPLLGFSGKFATFLQALDVTGVWTGMTQFGNWSFPPILNEPGPGITSIRMSSASGVAKNFELTANHTGGVQNLGLMSILIGDRISSKEVCQIILLPPNGINLISDTGVLAGPNLAPGTAGVLENSRCSISSSAAKVANSGNERTFSIPVTFSPLMAGPKDVYAVAFDTAGLLTHWVQGTQFTVTF